MNHIMYSFSIMKAANWILVVALAMSPVSAMPANLRLSVWLMPAENAGPNDIAQGERIPKELEVLRQSLEGTGVRLLNVEDPLADKARSWNPQFTVPNFQVIATQRKTLAALQRFASRHQIEVSIRFVTWDEAFGLLNAARTEGADALPDGVAPTAKRRALQKQTPGSASDPGALRDDCSSAPLDDVADSLPSRQPQSPNYDPRASRSDRADARRAGPGCHRCK